MPRGLLGHVLLTVSAFMVSVFGSVLRYFQTGRLQTDGALTVAGLVLNAYGELPPVGTTVELDGVRFEVNALENNRITRLLVTPPETEASKGGEGPDLEDPPGGGLEEVDTIAKVTIKSLQHIIGVGSMTG